MKHKGIMKLILSCVCLLGLIVPRTQVEAETTYKMWRLYNPNTGEHFYTASDDEKNNVWCAGWNVEGYGWVSPSYSNTPVYRVYNPNAGDHHYTTSVEEKNKLVAVGWKDEGVGWYACDGNTGIPVYREYNPYASTGAHNFTPSKEEHEYLVSIGWRDEGIAFYAAGYGGSEGSTGFRRNFGNGYGVYVGDVTVGSYSAQCFEAYGGASQAITDAEGTAYTTSYNGKTVIADHARQGFKQIMYNTTANFAGRGLNKVSEYYGRRSTYDITLNDGRSFYNVNDGDIIMYTCTDTSGINVYVSYWR